MEHAPYDMLFRRAFGTPQTARELAQNLLPAEWRQSLQIADLVTTDRKTALHIPHFEPIRVNLADLPEERLHGSVQTITGLLFLKYIKHRITA